ncbi:MAG: hypothetical protein LBK60_03060 [Verrucomicrobiales bacterium]|jgi:hypothetical protein|nr:hypothetical protein [Verrucomicrobiales bacterium]
MKRTSLNLDEEIYEKFLVLAKKHRRSASQMMNHLMEEALKNDAAVSIASSMPAPPPENITIISQRTPAEHTPRLHVETASTTNSGSASIRRKNSQP